MSDTASVVLCAVYIVKNPHSLRNDSPRSKKTCVRQVVLDEWLPLSEDAHERCLHGEEEAEGDSEGDGGGERNDIR